ncbi:Pleckstrin homology domain-containing family G member 5 [Oopsacas minuta]|uniref:Pleckstrin homology domain-containing family G member 5 n=1 Tax=Oopsacas minuta TaxID=111878 RepID=A0AAV7KAW2_9METZ|nr:Pleckstrin homology domain-containing family G member 5 [Oopsacas minuta]
MANIRHTISGSESISDTLASSLYKEKDILMSPQDENVNVSLNGEPNLWRLSLSKDSSRRRRNALFSISKFKQAFSKIELGESNEISIQSSTSISKMKENIETSNNCENTESIKDTFEKNDNDDTLQTNNIPGEEQSQKDTIVNALHWTDWISEEQLKGLTKQQLKQQEALWEFITRESEFISNLKIILSLFATRLDRLKHLDMLGNVHPENIFGGIKEIYQSHLSFWKECLHKCLRYAQNNKLPLSEQTFIETFPNEIESRFEVYLTHCLFATKYQEQILNAQKDDSFKEYLKWCQNQECSNHRSLADFLIQPLQHIMRYTLLLKAIRSHSTSEESKNKLTQLLEMLEAFLRHINSKVREQEEIEIVQQINEKLNCSSFLETTSPDEKFLSKYFKFDLLAPMPGLPFSMARILLKHSKLKMRDLTPLGLKTCFITHRHETYAKFNSVYVYLFTDIIILIRHNKIKLFDMIKHPILLGDIRLENHSPNQFYLISQSEFNMPTEILCFKASTQEIIESWMRAIKNASEKYTQAKHEFVNQGQFMQQIVDGKQMSLSTSYLSSSSSSTIESDFNSGFEEVNDKNTIDITSETGDIETQHHNRNIIQAITTETKDSAEISNNVTKEKYLDDSETKNYRRYLYRKGLVLRRKSINNHLLEEDYVGVMPQSLLVKT